MTFHSSKPVPVALLGAGGINRLVGQAVTDGRLPGVRVVAVAGSRAGSSTAAELAGQLGAHAVAPEDLGTAGATWVLEAAGGAAVRQHIPPLWHAGINTVVMSIGAMIDGSVSEAYRQALRAGVKVVLPSGGIAGLDGIRAMAASGDLHSVTITNVKHPGGLAGAPWLQDNSIELPEDRAMTVFEGSAREAIAAFPANVNVSVALALAGIGPDRTRVIVRSDPDAAVTFHRIEAEGDMTALKVEISSRPSPASPRTSVMAAASAISALQELTFS